MSADLYPRPSRDVIAAKVRGQLPGGQPPQPEREPDYPALFGTHLRARMRALGLTQSAIAERAGMSSQAAARAVNGNGTSIETAAKIAVIVGSDLLTMLQPYSCATCHGEPPAGFACLECGTETRPQSPGDRLATATAERTGKTG